MNYQVIAQNERRTRQNAVWLTIALHIALATFIYLQAGSTKPTPPTEVAQTTTTTAKAPLTKTRPLVRP